MPSVADTVELMKQRLAHECATLAKIRKELKELAPAYYRALDLRQQLDVTGRHIRYIVKVLGSGEILKQCGEAAILQDEVAMTSTPEGEMSDDLPLWRYVKEYLRVASEARIAEIQLFLKAVCRRSVSRQAIESAIRRHPGTFRVKKTVSEKYVSLKGAS